MSLLGIGGFASNLRSSRPLASRTDTQSRDRRAAARTYSRYSRSQIAHGALGSGTAAAQQAAHHYFSHLAWKTHRDAVVKAHKAARAKERKQKSSLGQAKIIADIFGQESPQNAFRDPLATLMTAMASRTKLANALLDASVRAGATRKSAKAQRDALWKLVHGDYGGKKPGLKVGGTDPTALGEVFASHHNVAHIDEYLAQLASGANPSARAALASVLLHEWAHTRQPERLWWNKHRAEGGAEAFSRDVGRKYGLKDTNPSYRKYVREVRGLGYDWIHRRQFK